MVRFSNKLFSTYVFGVNDHILGAWVNDDNHIWVIPQGAIAPLLNEESTPITLSLSQDHEPVGPIAFGDEMMVLTRKKFMKVSEVVPGDELAAVPLGQEYSPLTYNSDFEITSESIAPVWLRVTSVEENQNLSLHGNFISVKYSIVPVNSEYGLIVKTQSIV